MEAEISHLKQENGILRDAVSTSTNQMESKYVSSYLELCVFLSFPCRVLASAPSVSIFLAVSEFVVKLGNTGVLDWGGTCLYLRRARTFKTNQCLLSVWRQSRCWGPTGRIAQVFSLFCRVSVLLHVALGEELLLGSWEDSSSELISQSCNKKKKPQNNTRQLMVWLGGSWIYPLVFGETEIRKTSQGFISGSSWADRGQTHNVLR